MSAFQNLDRTLDAVAYVRAQMARDTFALGAILSNRTAEELLPAVTAVLADAINVEDDDRLTQYLDALTRVGAAVREANDNG